MGFKVAAGGLVFLLSVSVIQGQNDWGVTYTSTNICALKGSSVELRCTYRHPSRMNGRVTVVQKTFWFTKMGGSEPVDPSTDAEYAGRVQNHCDMNSCTLRITDLRESDSAEYKFRFITNQPGGKFFGSPGVTLTVTALQVKDTSSFFSTALSCHSDCRLPDNPSYVWYKNGQKTERKTYSYSGYISPGDSYVCAVEGHEDSHSPPVCVGGQSCNRVTYTHRSICAPKGSSVDISSTYSSSGSITSKLWFRSERSRQWVYQSQPEDLSEDPQYAGRVQVLETEGGRSTLRITELTERDSAQYHFKFTAGSFDWRSSLPGTTLTVTALQVQVTTTTHHQLYTEAELKCHSSCSPAGRLSFVWFKNGQRIMTEETSSYKDNFYPGDKISCAFKGREDYRSPSVYAPRLPSVSVSPSAEIVEGSSVNLTCSSEANPAATYTWYKEDQVLPVGSAGIHHFTSIRSEDRGIYYCTSEDQRSESLLIDVQYAPRLPSVSVSPSAEIVEGSSVNLTCSSDANPAATYTWYKEDEDSPTASGQIFTITDFRANQSGNYYCEARNKIGFQKSALYLNVLAEKLSVSNIIRLSLVVVMLIPLLLLCLWMRKKEILLSTTEPNEPAETVELEDDPDYINVPDVKRITTERTEDTEEQEDLV
ncbi:cell adhesion molecule CEACAM5-like [Pempheris klunzingeri]|uniref:cell adhesion molecule CEACAM5-like n=1 Tax=Pempheris klunzingeri TaxID=3127111 RepID=UPI00397FC379